MPTKHEQTNVGQEGTPPSPFLFKKILLVHEFFFLCPPFFILFLSLYPINNAYTIVQFCIVAYDTSLYKDRPFL